MNRLVFSPIVSFETGTAGARVLTMLPRDSSFFCSAGLAPTVRIIRGGEIIIATGRTPFVLRGREALRRIVQALVRARRFRGEGGQGGEGAMTVDDLFEAGWPGSGDALHAQSRAQRVYAAISRLRKLGLHGIIENDEGGYRLAASWGIESSGHDDAAAQHAPAAVWNLDSTGS